MDLDDTGGFDTRPEDVLFRRLVFLASKAGQIVEETVGKKRKCQLVFATLHELSTLILTHILEDATDLE